MDWDQVDAATAAHEQTIRALIDHLGLDSIQVQGPSRGAPAGPRVLVEPGGDLPVDLPAEGPDPNDFADLGEVECRLLTFQRRYKQTAVPVAWRFTRVDLDRLLRRLAGEERPLRVA